jgi:nitrogen regulatory protein P-II 1
MKKIEAIIRASKFEDLRETLSGMGLYSMTAHDVQSFGKEAATAQMYRGVSHQENFIPRTKIEMVVPEGRVEDVVRCILRKARTGQVGDGRIFILDVG